MRRLILMACLAAGCGGGEERAPLRLEAAGIRLEVGRRPYQVTISDPTGKVILQSLGDGTGDGYGAVGWTSGKLAILNTLSPGYFRFDLTLDPWRDALEVASATATADTITVTLAGEPRVVVTHTLRASTLRVEAHVEGDQAPRAWSAAFQAPAAEGYLGLGERYTRTNFRGLSIFSWAEEGGIGAKEGVPPDEVNPFPNGHSGTYYPVPFILSTGGYAAWLDTTYFNRFDLASDRGDAWRVFSSAPTLAYEIYLPVPGDPRPWPYQLIDLFTARTGRPMAAPPWAFGPRRRFGGGSRQGGVSELQAMRDLDLAITSVDDAFHFLPNGSSQQQRDAARVFIADARRLGYRVNGYFNSMYSSRATDNIAPLTAEGLEKNYFVKKTDGSPAQGWIITGGNVVFLYLLDFTSAAATAWYTSLFNLALDMGYSGWMYDFGEYVPGDAVSSTGLKGEEFHNLYPVLYQKAAHDALEALRPGDWLTFVRSGYTGASHWSPTVWSGDPAASFDQGDGLPSMIPAGVNAGVTGIPNWGGDIGGYHCISDGDVAADGELMTRWIQQGALSPIMQDQNACVGGDSDKKASIWSSPDAMEAWKTYARLHTRLFPYLYSLSRAAVQTGAPIMRHVFLEHPDRVDLAGVDDAYYLGPAIYVAPVVVRGARQKLVTLPAGSYLEWPEGRLVAGGAQVTLDAPLGKLPLLLRADQLVPLLDDRIDTLGEEDLPAIVGPGDVADVYDVVGLLGARASFTLYDGPVLEATLAGAFAPPPSREAETDELLRTCSECWKRDVVGAGVQRIRITATGNVAAGGLTLKSSSTRRIRWDLYLLTSP